MPKYKGNAIYDYIVHNNLDYHFCTENSWILIYGNSMSIPKVLVFVSKVADIKGPFSVKEKENADKAYYIAEYLDLPFVFVRFMPADNSIVSVWESCNQRWRLITYDQLRVLYERYGVVQPGGAKKYVNQYTSSYYHDWQRANLGQITVSDLDLLIIRDSSLKEIIELKRSKVSINRWTPYDDDYPNFALVINTIVKSKKPISFKIYYNLMKEGQIGNRDEDISKIRVFEFVIPDTMIGPYQLRYNDLGIYNIEDLL